ncbi:alpha/beta hydrolase [Chitinophagales bacterium]|nr:alpha/beta hydrolase [Chitinophagales bacterium]
MDWTIQQKDNYEYIDVGEGPVLLLLHGLFGALSNFSDLITHFSATNRVIIPILPLYKLPLKECGVPDLRDFVHEFVLDMGIESLTLVGNSLGGHISLLYVIDHPEFVNAMVLTGSSGLFENTMGDTFPQRGNRDFIHNKTASTFYDPAMATTELVDEVFGIVNDRDKVIRVITMARSAIRHNLSELLHQIETPTLLIWGKDDIVTPAFVGEEFAQKIKNSELYFIDKCGHAPMMECPTEFNKILSDFLQRLPVTQST